MPKKETMRQHTLTCKMWADLLSKVLFELNPDILVGDFMTFSAALCADLLKIPYVIN
jgi:hypothetical protein